MGQSASRHRDGTRCWRLKQPSNTHNKSPQCKQCRQTKQKQNKERKQSKRCRQCEQVGPTSKTCNDKTATDTTTSRDLLDTVPDEILLMIMSALPRSDLKTLNSVCHRLFRMINQTLWDEPVFKKRIEYVDLEEFRKIKSRIKVLRWSQFYTITCLLLS